VPVKTFRDLRWVTGDNTAFGLPSLVMVTSWPPATNSSSAENFAGHPRTGMDSPTPGNATASLSARQDGLGGGYSIARFAFTAPM